MTFWLSRYKLEGGGKGAVKWRVVSGWGNGRKGRVENHVVLKVLLHIAKLAATHHLSFLPRLLFFCHFLSFSVIWSDHSCPFVSLSYRSVLCSLLCRLLLLFRLILFCPVFSFYLVLFCRVHLTETQGDVSRVGMFLLHVTATFEYEEKNLEMVKGAMIEWIVKKSSWWGEWGRD